MQFVKKISTLNIWAKTKTKYKAKDPGRTSYCEKNVEETSPLCGGFFMRITGDSQEEKQWVKENKV